MNPIQLFSIISWIALPTVMFGGYSLLGLLARSNTWLTSFRSTYFRAGCAHFLRRRFDFHDSVDCAVRFFACLSRTRCPGCAPVFHLARLYPLGTVRDGPVYR